MKTSEINVLLSCGHEVRYDKIQEPCAECNKKQEIIPEIEGELMDEMHGVIIKLFSMMTINNLNCEGNLKFVNGNLVLVVKDVKKNKVYEFKSDQIHKLYEALSKRMDDWKELAGRGKSVIRAILDKDYYKRYFDRMDILIPKWKVFMRKRPVAILTTMVFVLIGGVLSVLL